MASTSYRDIATVIIGMLDAGRDAQDTAKALAQYLVAERRVNELDRILREVESQRLAKDGILEVEAASAKRLSDEVKQQITTLFPDNQVILEETIDKNLVGGVKIQASDTLIDLSVRGQLSRLKQHNF